MAATRKPYDAINLWARPFIRHMQRISEAEDTILDFACQELWMDAPWRWTLGSTETLTLVANTQDIAFTAPITGPTDLLYVAYSYLTDGVGPSRDVSVVPALPVDTVLKGQPSQVSFLPGATAKMRLFPCPPAMINTTKLVSTYKKVAPVITRVNMMTAGTLVMDDEWFHVYAALVLHYAYQYADDPRADSQYQKYQAKVLAMRQRERLSFWLDRDLAPERRKETFGGST